MNPKKVGFNQKRRNANMHRYLLTPTMALVVIAIGGCASSSRKADSISYDPAVRRAEGTVIVSDPKLYSRETLVDERGKEIARINELIKKADTVQFKPEIIREIEQIRAISAALGLKFDPAAGLNYRRAEETGDLQQEINTLRLQLQLDQLRRDAELLRAKLPNQTDPLNADLGVINAGSPAALNSQSTTAGIAQLKEQVDRLTDLIKSMSGNGIALPNATTVSSNPIDDFRDKQAYLDMLRSARNSASLDDLHDLDAALIRLNFQATVIPDSKYPKSLAAIQMVVKGPLQEDDDKNTFLLSWLKHINKSAWEYKGNSSSENYQIDDLKSRDILTEIEINKKKFWFPSTLPESFDRVPSSVLKNNITLQELIDAADWDHDEVPYRSRGWMEPGGTADREKVFLAICGQARSEPLWTPQQKQVHRTVIGDLTKATARILTYEYAEAIDSWLKEDGSGARFARTRADSLGRSKDLIRALRKFTPDNNIETCKKFTADFPASEPKIGWGSLMGRLEEASRKGQVRIYEVGPREQVQQVSTSARSADSLLLAASIAASAPSSGAAGEAALNYSKIASRRATALERAPSVVGYSIGGKSTFGWVLGPRVVIDSKGGASVENRLKPYDLSVDMSVPVWWTKLNLTLTTTWGPSPSELANGTASINDQSAGNMCSTTASINNQSAGNMCSTIVVPFSRKAPDYEWFTENLVGPQPEHNDIYNVSGGPVNACFPSALFITGRNIWRAEKVMIFGQILDRDRITIAPDMKGILLNVPKIPPPVGDRSQPQNLFVFTPRQTLVYSGYIGYQSSPSGEACTPKKEQADRNQNRPIISELRPDPLRFNVPAELKIQIKGKNLGNITAVWLHDKKGKLDLLSDDIMMITFTKDQSESFPESDAVKLEFIGKVGDSEELLETKSIVITR